MPEKQTKVERNQQPSTSLGKSMVDYAKRLKTWSDTETNLTHKDMVLRVGALTLVGGAILALNPQFIESPELSSDQVMLILDSLKPQSVQRLSYHDGLVGVTIDDTYKAWSGWYTNLEVLARNLADVSQGAVTNGLGENVSLLSADKSDFISQQLDKIQNIRDLVTGTGIVGILNGVGEIASSLSSMISSDKVVNSTTVVPAFANLVNKIGESL